MNICNFSIKQKEKLIKGQAASGRIIFIPPVYFEILLYKNVFY